MQNKETKSIMPAINQIFRDAALQHLAECGLPESLIDGVDCSTLENMERTLSEVKECVYSSIKRHIENTYGSVSKEKTPIEQWKQLTEYRERNWWEMLRKMDCDPENNKYIANLHSLISNEMQTGEFSEEWKRLEHKERLLINILRTGINEEDADKFTAYLDLEGEMRGQIEKEGFICGFRTAYHLLKECCLS